MKANPAESVKTGSDGERDTILDDALAYGRLFKTLDRMEAERRIRRPVADAIRVIALTGARRGEIAGMQWQHVDLRAGTVTLPPARHKTGAKTGKPRIIGLPAAAQAIIARQPAGSPTPTSSRPPAATGRSTSPSLGTRFAPRPSCPRGSACTGSGIRWRAHMAMEGAQAAEIMTALGHRNMATSQKYVHAAQDARQRIAEKAAATALAGMAAAGSAEGGVFRLGHV